MQRKKNIGEVIDFEFYALNKGYSYGKIEESNLKGAFKIENPEIKLVDY